MAYTSGAPVGNGLASTGTITANAQTVVANVEASATAIFQVLGTFAGANVTFEGSGDGGTTWYALQVLRSGGTATLETTSGVLGAAPAYNWKANTGALTHVRVRATAFTSGTQNWTITTGYEPSEPVVVTQPTGTQPISGTVTSTPNISTAFSLVTAATTNATSVKASAGSLYEITISNVTATAAFVKIYNKASAPTVGTDIPVLTISAPANTTVALNFGPLGKRLASGTAYAVTAAIAATDTAATVAGIQIHGCYI